MHGTLHRVLNLRNLRIQHGKDADENAQRRPRPAERRSVVQRRKSLDRNIKETFRRENRRDEESGKRMRPCSLERSDFEETLPRREKILRDIPRRRAALRLHKQNGRSVHNRRSGNDRRGKAQVRKFRAAIRQERKIFRLVPENAPRSVRRADSRSRKRESPRHNEEIRQILLRLVSGKDRHAIRNPDFHPAEGHPPLQDNHNRRRHRHAGGKSTEAKEDCHNRNSDMLRRHGRRSLPGDVPLRKRGVREHNERRMVADRVGRDTARHSRALQLNRVQDDTGPRDERRIHDSNRAERENNRRASPFHGGRAGGGNSHIPTADDDIRDARQLASDIAGVGGGSVHAPHRSEKKKNSRLNRDRF